MNALESLKFFIPEGILLCGALAVLFLDFGIVQKKWLGFLSLGVITSAFLAALFQGPVILPLFYDFFRLDGLTFFSRFIALGVVAVTLLTSLASKEIRQVHEGEYYALFLVMPFALTLMAGAVNWLMVMMAIEFVSLLSYLLVGFMKKSERAKEAAMKYFLFGSLASGIMLFGMTLLFGVTGTLDLTESGRLLSAAPLYGLAMIAFFFILAGIGFKTALAPFHLWAPDVYESAPTPVTAFLTVAPKALAFTVLLRILIAVFPWFSWKWTHALALVSILTMTIGNFAAIAQTNIKRLLAYSSIAQAGYILMGFAAMRPIGIAGVFVYLAAYAFTNLGAFTIVVHVVNHTGREDLGAFSGLARRSPFLAASMTVFLLSLAGIPPLAGFIGKFLVFAGAIDGGWITLAVIAALNSAVAAFYYFKVIRAMYLEPAECEDPIAFRGEAKTLQLALMAMLAGTVLIGCLPDPLIQTVQILLFK